MQLYYKMDRIMRLKFLRDLKMDKRDGPVSPRNLSCNKRIKRRKG